jgi:hypothetical protein
VQFAIVALAEKKWRLEEECSKLRLEKTEDQKKIEELMK